MHIFLNDAERLSETPSDLSDVDIYNKISEY